MIGALVEDFPRRSRGDHQLKRKSEKMSDSDDYDLLPDEVEDNLSTTGSNFFDCLVRS